MVQVTRFPKLEQAHGLVDRETDVNTGVAVLLRCIADEIVANKGSPAELEALAAALTSSGSLYSTALTANTGRPAEPVRVSAAEAAAHVQSVNDAGAERRRRQTEADEEAAQLEREKAAEEERAKQANETTKQTNARHRAEDKAEQKNQ